MASYCRPVRSKIGKESLFYAFLFFSCKFIDANLLCRCTTSRSLAQRWKGSEPPKWSWVKENTNMTIFAFVFRDQLFLQGRSYTDLHSHLSKFSNAVLFSSVWIRSWAKQRACVSPRDVRDVSPP